MGSRQRTLAERNGWARAALAAIVLALPANDTLATGRAVLEPAPDPGVSAVLERHFALPLALAVPDQTAAARTAAIGTETRRLTALLHALGYLDAGVEVRGDAAGDGPVRLRPTPGALYRTGWIRIDGLPKDGGEALRNAIDGLISSRVGEAASADAVADIREGVLWRLREASFARAAITDLRITAEPATRTAGISVGIEPGPPVRFGTVRFEGSTRVDASELAGLVPFSAGDPYRASAMASLGAGLERANLFRRTRMSLAEAPDAAGQTAVIVELRDAPPDPKALADSSGAGPYLLAATILLLVLRECARATRAWRSPALRAALAIAAVLMVASSGLVIVERVIGFLS